VRSDTRLLPGRLDVGGQSHQPLAQLRVGPAQFLLRLVQPRGVLLPALLRRVEGREPLGHLRLRFAARPHQRGLDMLALVGLGLQLRLRRGQLLGACGKLPQQHVQLGADGVEFLLRFAGGVLRPRVLGFEAERLLAQG
jgi:hypothetical protein